MKGANNFINVRLLKFLITALVFGLTVFYLLLTSGIFFKDYINIVSNTLNNILMVIVSIYITFNISKASFSKDNENNQKKIANTSVRYIRNNADSVSNLIERVNQIQKNIEGESILQYLTEINNSLKQIRKNILSTESDFKNLVNEELELEQNLLGELDKKIELMRENFYEINKFTNKQDNKNKKNMGEIKNISNELSKLKSETKNIVKNLPYGLPSSEYDDSILYLSESDEGKYNYEKMLNNITRSFDYGEDSLDDIDELVREYIVTGHNIHKDEDEDEKD